jgi:hypothetical protein
MRNRIGFITIGLLFPLIFQGALCFGQGIEIESGATIAITGAASLEIVDGDLNIAGSYTSDVETIKMSGSTKATIEGGAISLYDLEITNTDGITTNTTSLITHDLTIAAAAGFTIPSTSAVTVSNALSNEGIDTSLIIKSDATSTGSLFTSTDGEPIRVERYLGGSQWHIISPSAGSVNIQSF